MVVEVVSMFNIAVTAAVPEMLAVVVGHTGSETAPVGLAVTVQVRLTVPEKPPDGVSVTVEPAVAPGVLIVTGVAAMARDGVGATFTVTATMAEEVTLPVAASTPLTVSE